MADEKLRDLWRQAGTGDLDAAISYVVELMRNQGPQPDQSFLRDEQTKVLARWLVRYNGYMIYVSSKNRGFEAKPMPEEVQQLRATVQALKLQVRDREDEIQKLRYAPKTSFSKVDNDIHRFLNSDAAGP